MFGIHFDKEEEMLPLISRQTAFFLLFEEIFPFVPKLPLLLVDFEDFPDGLAFFEGEILPLVSQIIETIIEERFERISGGQNFFLPQSSFGLKRRNICDSVDRKSVPLFFVDLPTVFAVQFPRNDEEERIMIVDGSEVLGKLHGAVGLDDISVVLTRLAQLDSERFIFAEKIFELRFLRLGDVGMDREIALGQESESRFAEIEKNALILPQRNCREKKEISGKVLESDSASDTVPPKLDFTGIEIQADSDHFILVPIILAVHSLRCAMDGISDVPVVCPRLAVFPNPKL